MTSLQDPQDLLRASAEGDLDEVVALMKAGVSLDTTDKVSAGFLSIRPDEEGVHAKVNAIV